VTDAAGIVREFMRLEGQTSAESVRRISADKRLCCVRNTGMAATVGVEAILANLTESVLGVSGTPTSTACRTWPRRRCRADRSGST